MPHSRLSCLFLLALMLIAGRAPAQESKGPGTLDPELQKKAVELLRNVADQVVTLQSAENRARLGANLAASLWKHDEQRARTLLGSVESDINAGLQKAEEDERTTIRTRNVFLKLRTDTIQRIAQLDAEAALAFLKATEPDAELMKSREIAEMALRLEIQLANEIVAENPELALKLGRNSLAHGFSNDLFQLLRRLSRKHKEKAQILYKEIVAKLVKTGLEQYSPATYFAFTLAGEYKPPKVDEPTYRELIRLFIDTASEHGCGTKTPEDGEYYFCQEFARFLPKSEKIDTSPAADSTFPSEESDVPFDRELYEDIEDLARHGTVDEMLTLATKHPELKELIYMRAVQMAALSGEIERARELATRHVTDPNMRQEIMAEIDEVRAWRSMTAEKLAEVQKIISTIPHVLGRVSFVLNLANQIGVKDRKTVLKLLSQAGEMVETMKPGHEKTQAEISLAMMYCLEKDDRGFAKMQELMPKLNDLIAASVKLDDYESDSVTDGEWNMSANGSLGGLLTMLSEGAGYFAWCDFDRALNLARQFERSEIRLMAELKLAQAILAGPPKSQQLTFPNYSVGPIRR